MTNFRWYLIPSVVQIGTWSVSHYLGACSRSESLSLPPAHEVCEGYVFTRVCHSVHGRGSAPGGWCLVPGVCSGGGGFLVGGRSAPGGSAPGGAWWGPPPAATAGRFLLGCILVFLKFP